MYPNHWVGRAPLTLTATIEDFSQAIPPRQLKHGSSLIPPLRLSPSLPRRTELRRSALHSFFGSLSEPATLTLNGEKVLI